MARKVGTTVEATRKSRISDSERRELNENYHELLATLVHKHCGGQKSRLTYKRRRQQKYDYIDVKLKTQNHLCHAKAW